MKKSKLIGTIFTVASSLPILSQPNIFNTEVCAQEEEKDNFSYDAELHNYANQFSLYADNVNRFGNGGLFYFPNNGFDALDREILQTLDSLIEANTDNLQARNIRGHIYKYNLNNWKKAVEDYEYILENQERVHPGKGYVVNGDVYRIKTEGTGSITGRLVSNGEQVLNGAVLLYSGHEWHVSMVRDGSFDFLYNHKEVSKPSSVPLIFLAEGKKPVFKALELTEENAELDLGEIALNDAANEGVSFAGFVQSEHGGCVYYGPGVNPPVFVNLAPNENASLGDNFSITSDEKGFFYKTLEVPVASLEFLDESIRQRATNGTIVQLVKVFEDW